MTNSDPINAKLTRRLLSTIYDGFLIIALLMLATLPLVITNDGEAVRHNLVFSIYLLCIMFLYCAWQWRLSGQTLAMTTWKIKVISNNGAKLSWSQCIIRFIASLFGLGLITGLFDKDKLTIADKLSNTRCIKL